MKLAVIFPILNQSDLANTAIDFALANCAKKDTQIIALDNGSTPPFKRENLKDLYLPTTRLDNNIGVYPTFWEGLKHTDADIIAFLHSDLIISEYGWDKRLIQAFEMYPKLGLIGFVGSNEIDSNGGRGLGTTSNFQGLTTERHLADGSIKSWTGSKATVHGKCDDKLSKAAVVDGCAMVFRREVLEKIKQRDNFPPHHFYDRLLSCEVRELGYDVAVLGIACDHISGQTVNQEEDYSDMAKQWAVQHGLDKNFRHNWDSVLYQEAEKQFLSEYRDQKHLIPCKV